MKNTTTAAADRIETYPVAAAAYLPGDKRGSLTHAMNLDTWTPLCGRVKAASVLDDGCWGDVSSAPTCPACAKKDPRKR